MQNSNNKNTEKDCGIAEFIKNTAIYWLIGFSIIMSGIAIFFSFKPIEIKSNECSIILTFVGIIATFIVVGNYAQVITIKKDFDDNVQTIKKDSDDNIKKLNNIVLELKSSQSQTEKKLLESKGYFHFSMATSLVTKEEYDGAFYGYAKSLVYFLKSNIKETNSVFNQLENLLTHKKINKTLLEDPIYSNLIKDIQKECKTVELAEMYIKLNKAIQELT